MALNFPISPTNGQTYLANGVLYTYDSTATLWTATAPSSVPGLIQYRYVATASQTIFTGADANANTLSLTSGKAIVTVNGILLTNGTDYTSTTTSVTLIVGALVNDEVGIIAFDAFAIADLGSAADKDAGTSAGNVLLLDGAGKLAGTLLTGTVASSLLTGALPAIDGSALTNMPHDPRPDLIVQAIFGAAVNGATLSSGADRVLVLNTVVRNTLGVSLTTNTITGLVAGDYYIEWNTDFHSVTGDRFAMSFLYDNTGAADLIVGHAVSLRDYSSRSGHGEGIFTLSTTSTISLRGRVNNTVYNGNSATFNSTRQNLFTTLKLWKVQ